MQRGVSRFDAANGGLGGCPYSPGATGNLATEDVVHMVEDSGARTGIDLDKLISCGQLAEQLVGRQLPAQVLRSVRSGPRTRTVAS